MGHLAPSKSMCCDAKRTIRAPSGTDVPIYPSCSARTLSGSATSPEGIEPPHARPPRRWRRPERARCPLRHTPARRPTGATRRHQRPGRAATVPSHAACSARRHPFIDGRLELRRRKAADQTDSAPIGSLSGAPHPARSCYPRWYRPLRLPEDE